MRKQTDPVNKELYNIMNSIASHVKDNLSSKDCIDDVMKELQKLFNTRGMGDMAIRIGRVRDEYMDSH